MRGTSFRRTLFHTHARPTLYGKRPTCLSGYNRGRITIYCWEAGSQTQHSPASSTRVPRRSAAERLGLDFGLYCPSLFWSGQLAVDRVYMDPHSACTNRVRHPSPVPVADGRGGGTQTARAICPRTLPFGQKRRAPAAQRYQLQPGLKTPSISGQPVALSSVATPAIRGRRDGRGQGNEGGNLQSR
ncbi:hypothetical protein SRHO_G00325090 [Serrasalmus rhombeus]